MLVELQPDTIGKSNSISSTMQTSRIFAGSRDRTKLMSAMDALNDRYLRGLGALGVE